MSVTWLSVGPSHKAWLPPRKRGGRWGGRRWGRRMGRMNPSPLAIVPCHLIGQRPVSLGPNPSGLGCAGRGGCSQELRPRPGTLQTRPPLEGRGGRRAPELGAVRRAEHRGSWVGHGRLKSLTCCSSRLALAPPRRAARALQKVLSEEPAPVPRADPGSGERAPPVRPAPGCGARARGDKTLGVWGQRPCGSRPPRGRL